MYRAFILRELRCRQVAQPVENQTLEKLTNKYSLSYVQYIATKISFFCLSTLSRTLTEFAFAPPVQIVIKIKFMISDQYSLIITCAYYIYTYMGSISKPVLSLPLVSL